MKNKNFRVTREKEGVKLPTRYYSNKQEKEVVKSIGGRQTSNSGATPWDKGDVSIGQFLLEMKTKMRPTTVFSIKKEWLDKIEQEALFMGKPHTALVFNFEPNGKNYYVVTEEVFKTFIKEN